MRNTDLAASNSLARTTLRPILLLVSIMTAGCASGPEPAASTKSPGIPIETVEPPYPAAALEQCTGGEVVFKFSLSEEGRPIDIKIARSTPEGMFDHAAYASFRRWQFLLPKNHAPWNSYEFSLEFQRPEACAAKVEPAWTFTDDTIPYAACKDGRVVLGFIIDEGAVVRNLQILSSDMPVEVDIALLDMVAANTEAFGIEPRVVDGKPRRRRARLPFDFSKDAKGCQ